MQAAAIVDATAQARSAISDIGADAIDPADEGEVGVEPAPSPVGEVVGAVEPKARGEEPSLAPEGELVGATEYKLE